MPAHPAGVRDPCPEAARCTSVSAPRAPAELREAEHQADDRQQAPDGRRPDHDVVPQRLVRAQRGEVDPMRNRSDPGQRPAAPRGHHHHLARSRRDVEFSRGGVVDHQLVQRKLPPLHQRPLVGLGERADVLDGAGWLAGEPTRDDDGRRRSYLVESLPGVREDGHAVETVGRPIHHGQQRGCLRRRRQVRPPGRGRRGQLDTVEVQLRQPFESQLRGEPRHVARVHHHDAGGEPDHEEGAERNAQIAMDQDQGPVEQTRHDRQAAGSCPPPGRVMRKVLPHPGSRW